MEAASAEKLPQLKSTAPPRVLADIVEEVPYTWLALSCPYPHRVGGVWRKAWKG